MYTVYASNSQTVGEGTKLYNQTTLAISDVKQGETYVITIIAVNDVGEGEPAMINICKYIIEMVIIFQAITLLHGKLNYVSLLSMLEACNFVIYHQSNISYVPYTL